MFRGLRNQDPVVSPQMLHNVNNGLLPLQQLNKVCQDVKKVRELKKKFVDLLGLSSWNEAEEKYPDFAIESKLTENIVIVRLLSESHHVSYLVLLQFFIHY